MRISITATNIELTPALENYALKKVGAISKLVKSFERDNEVEVYLELARTTKHHKSGRIYYAEVNTEVDGRLIRVTKKEEDLREAIDALKNTLQREIKKLKGEKLTKRRLRRK